MDRREYFCWLIIALIAIIGMAYLGLIFGMTPGPASDEEIINYNKKVVDFTTDNNFINPQNI